MIINGFIYLFDVCLFSDNGAKKRIAVCSTIEEAVKEVEKYEPGLKDGECIDINSCEVGGIDCGEAPILENATSIDGFGTPKSNGQTVEEYCRMVIEDLTLETPPALPDTQYPKKQRINYKKGPKNTSISEYDFLDGYYEVIKVKKNSDLTEWEGMSVIPEEEYDRIICPKCWMNIEKCECEEWSNYYIQIDPMIAEAIRNLNRKGYFTSHCCEGHDWDNSEAYVGFDAYYDFATPIPKGWEQRGSRLYCQFILSLEGKETFDEIKKRMLDSLTKWTEELPALEDAYID